jgi:hypothetical protein
MNVAHHITMALLEMVGNENPSDAEKAIAQGLVSALHVACGGPDVEFRDKLARALFDWQQANEMSYSVDLGCEDTRELFTEYADYLAIRMGFSDAGA